MGRVIKVTDEGSVDLYEAHANGAHKISLKAPAALVGDLTLILPPDAGTAGYLLRTDGVNTLTWEPSTGTEEFDEITLLNQGRISLREATGNGTNFVGFRAPASLAASIDFTMPPALPLTTQFLSCDDAGQWAYADGTSTLQSAYDEGEDIALSAGNVINVTQAADEAMISFIKAGAGAGRLVTIEDAGTGGCLLITQTGNGVALEITKAAGAANVVTIAPTGAISGAGTRITMPSAGSGIGLDVANDGSGIGIKATQATTAAILAQLNQGTISHALDINRTSVASATLAALDISDSATGTGSAINVSKESGSAGSAVTVNQGNVSPGAVITQSTNGICVRLFKSGTGAGTVLDIENDGTGTGIAVQQDTVSSALTINRTPSSSASLAALLITDTPDGIALQIDKGANGGTSIKLNHTNTNLAFYMDQQAAGRGARFEKSGAGADPVIELANAGTGADILGSSSTWSITKTGHGIFKALVSTAGSVLTIASGVITATNSYHLVDTEAAAASDDLDTISTSLPSGTRLVLRANNSARTVTVKDGTGNLAMAGDFALNNDQDTIEFIFDGAAWYELGRSDNGA